MKFNQVQTILEADDFHGGNFSERKTSTDINVATTFLSEMRQLVSVINEITHTYNSGSLTDHSVWKRYYRKTLSRWFAEHYPIVKDAASALAKRGSALKRISRIPVYGQKYDVSPFTKGQGYWMLHDNVPQACLQLGEARVGEDYIAAFNRMMKTIAEGTQTSALDNVDQSDENFDSFFFDVKDPNYHEKLKDHTTLKGDQKIDSDQAVSQIMASFSPKERKILNPVIWESKEKLQTLQYLRKLSQKAIDIIIDQISRQSTPKLALMKLEELLKTNDLPALPVPPSKQADSVINQSPKNPRDPKALLQSLKPEEIQQIVRALRVSKSRDKTDELYKFSKLSQSEKDALIQSMEQQKSDSGAYATFNQWISK